MVVEELIAKLGFKVGNLDDVKKFTKALEDARKALKGKGAGANANFGKVSGLDKVARDFERAAAAARRFRREAQLASKVSYGGAGIGVGVGARPGAARRNARAEGRAAVAEALIGVGSSAVAAKAARAKPARSGPGIGAGVAGEAALAGAGLSLGRVGVAAGTAYGVGRLGSRALNSSMDFERAMIEVAKATDAKGAERESYAEQITRLARDTGKNKEDLAGMLAAAGFAGRPKDELMRFTEFGAKATSAWGTSAAETGDSLAQIGNIYEANQAEIERIADQINTMADKSASKEIDLLEIVRRVGGTGKTAGMSSGDILGFGAGLKERGVQTEVASSGIETYINFLKLGEEYSKHSEDTIKALGYTSDGLRKAFIKAPTETAIKFLEKLNAVKDPSKRATLLTDAFGKERQDDVERLASSIEKIKANIAMINNPSNYKGSVMTQFAEMMTNDVAKIDKATQQIDVLMKRIGDPLKRAAGAGAEQLNKTLDDIDNRTLNKSASPQNAYDELPGLEHLRPDGMTRSQFDERFQDPTTTGTRRSFMPNAGMGIPDVFRSGKGKKRTLGLGYEGQGQQTGMAPTFSPGNFGVGGIGDGGAAMAQKAMQQVTNNVTNNTNTGNDQRTQSVTVNQTVNGVPGVASAAAEGAKSGLASMGASVAKGNNTPTVELAGP